MNCMETRRWMSPYVDSELGQTKTFEIDDHLAKCPTCAARFTLEARVDELVQARLERDVMPQALWSRIERDVSTPEWIRRLCRPRMLAAAAAIAVVLFSGSAWFYYARASQPWIARQLVAMAPANEPFVRTGAAEFVDEIELHRRLGVLSSVQLPLGLNDGHDLQLVDVSVQLFADGRPYVEVRLNCCGEPVLLVLTKTPRRACPIRELDGMSTSGATAIAARAGLNTGSRNIGGITAVAASRHPVDCVLNGLTLMDD